MADHRFEIVPDTECAEETPPASREKQDPRWFADSPRKSPQQKRQTKVKFADDDIDSEAQWQGNVAGGGGGGKGKKNAGRKKQKGKSDKDLVTRFFKNGFWIMKQPPSKDAKGFYRRPAGRAPTGFEWE